MPSRVWLITGANSGMGLALAKCVLEHGDRVIATARDVSKIPESIAGAKPIRLDLNAPDEEISQVGLYAVKIYGRIDVLVNNAGWGLPGVVEHLKDQDLKDNFQANVWGPLSLTRSLLPAFREQRAGHIVSISSQGALRSFPTFSAYCASKATLDAFMEALSAEIAPFGVKVVIAQPGMVMTDWWTKAAELSKSTTHGDAAVDPAYAHLLNMDALMDWAIGTGNVGDLSKTVWRIYEFITETGMADKSLEKKPEWIRLPLGMDCKGIYTDKLALLQDNLQAFMPLTESVNLDEEELKRVQDSRRLA